MKKRAQLLKGWDLLSFRSPQLLLHNVIISSTQSRSCCKLLQRRASLATFSAHKALPLSQVQAGEQWTTAYAVHKKPGQRRVARHKLRPSGTDATVAITVGVGHVEVSVLTRTISGAMRVELNERRTLVLQCLSGLLLPEVSLPLLPWE